MYYSYSDETISYLQANKILALKLDHAVAGVEAAVSSQLDSIGAGAQRALFYTSCFTDEYQDVCKRQGHEDIRFGEGVYHLLRHGNVVFDMLKIYFETLFRHKTSDQLEHIKRILMEVNIHIAASSLSNLGFSFAVAGVVSLGTNLSMEMSVTVGRGASLVVATAGVYGIVQKAADSARRLQVDYPEYYTALYFQNLEMMYFLIEPLFVRAGALKTQWASDEEIANIIKGMIR